MQPNRVDDYAAQQGIRGMEIRRRVRERLQAEGLSIEGYRQLLNKQPIESEADREVLLRRVMGPLLAETAAAYDAELARRAGCAPDAEASET